MKQYSQKVHQIKSALNQNENLSRSLVSNHINLLHFIFICDFVQYLNLYLYVGLSEKSQS